MRGAESLTVTSAYAAETTPGYSAPSVSPVAPSPIVSISSRVILPISIVVSIISSLLLLMRPAAHYVENAAGLKLTDIA